MTDPRMPGRTIALVATMAGAALSLYLAPAVLEGDLAAQGDQLLGLAWGRVLLLDVYAGIALFAGWIAWRETRTAAAVWIAALVLLGNVVACVYLLRAWWSAAGDGDIFWHGHRQRVATTDFAE
jgi:hypothetical protein